MQTFNYAVIVSFMFVVTLIDTVVAYIKRFPLITTWAVASAISLAGAPVLGMVATMTGCAIVIVRNMK